MGCGRSSIAKIPDNKDENSNENQESNKRAEKSSNVKLRRRSLFTSTIPNSQAGRGSALLAQAKISASQLDFFKLLDQRIEDGSDCSRESDDSLEIRLKSRLEMWNNMVLGKRKVDYSGKSAVKNGKTLDNASTTSLRSDCNTSVGVVSLKSNDTRLVEKVEEIEICSPHQRKEQYMFMGNIYTLSTSSDGKQTVPHIDVNPAQACDNNRNNDGKPNCSSTVEKILRIHDKEVHITFNALNPDPGIIYNHRQTERGSKVKGQSKVVKGLNDHREKGEKVAKVYNQESNKKILKSYTEIRDTFSVRQYRPSTLMIRSIFPSHEQEI